MPPRHSSILKLINNQRKTEEQQQKKRGSEKNTMGNLFKEPSSLTKKLFPYFLYALLPIAFIRLYFYPIPISLSSSYQIPQNTPTLTTAAAASSSSSSVSPPSTEDERESAQITCDYSNGKWVPDKLGPLYNDTSCGTIKEGRNCMSHGRPDLGYLFWRWSPKNCNIPRLRSGLVVAELELFEDFTLFGDCIESLFKDF